MFNGIIFNKGNVNKIKKSTKGVNIFVKSNLKVKMLLSPPSSNSSGLLFLSVKA